MDMGNFLAQLSFSDGLARQNRFEVWIPTIRLGRNSKKINDLNQAKLQFPDDSMDWMNDYLDTDLPDLSWELTAYCEKGQLPGQQFQLETNRHYGPNFKVPHLVEYPEITLTFMCGSQMLERYFFDAWLYMIHEPSTHDFNYKDEYAVEIDIIQYMDRSANGKSVDPNYWTKLIDAFPISVNSQELGYSLNNTYQTVEVTFSYREALPWGISTVGMPRRGDEEQFAQTIIPTD